VFLGAKSFTFSARTIVPIDAVRRGRQFMPELFDVVVVTRSIAAAHAPDGRRGAVAPILRRLVTGLDRKAADAWARSFNRAERERPYGVRAEVHPQLAAAPPQFTLGAATRLERSA
jgi:hypothetical protein